MSVLFLINLDSALARRRHMRAQLDGCGIDYVRIGFDMRYAQPAEVRARARAVCPQIEFDLNRISTAEAGCWLSHWSAWARFYRHTDHSTCTVIEDDICLDRPLFIRAMQTLARGHDCDVAYLGTSSRNISTKRFTACGEFTLHEVMGSCFNTWGYSVTRTYLAALFAQPHQLIDMPIDHFLGARAHPMSPSVAVLRPQVVCEEPDLGEQSQIAPFTARVDRNRIVGALRRRFLTSRLADAFYSIYRFL